MGKIDSSLETVGIYSMDAKDSDEFDQGVFFQQDKIEVVIGVLWNSFNHISIARRVVAINMMTLLKWRNYSTCIRDLLKVYQKIFLTLTLPKNKLICPNLGA